ncbi:MAG: VCBS repeat-containing protein, partial [Verrucomicrobiota bacterium]|nr:VCBS repeat-containing protein [Verrucomicrobiota bacterium]
SSLLALGFVMLASCEGPESRADSDSPGAGPTASSAGSLQSSEEAPNPEGSLQARPLATRSQQTGKALFRRLVPEETGVAFQNMIDTTHPLKRLYHSGFVCGGVAIGDIDGDGLPDLFLASGPGKNKLYRQTGEPFQFEDITVAAGVDGGDDWGTGAAMADLDNDGDLDIYVCNYDSPNALYLNNGAGEFSEVAERFGLARVDACLLPTFCDYDQDGDLDVFLLTNRYYREGGRPAEPPFEQTPDGKARVKEEFRKYYGLTEKGPGAYDMDEVGRPDILLRNDGGRFTDVSHESGIQVRGHGLSATWWDYDHDGLMDLYVCNDFADPDNLFRNNGDGTFTDTITSVVNYTPWFSMGADAGDINNDGQLDFVALDMAATTHYKSKMAMGEMGVMRYVIEKAKPRQVMRNCLYVSTGMGRYIECASLSGVSSSDWSWAAKLADFDNDGRVDLFISNGMARDFNNSDITFTPADQ